MSLTRPLAPVSRGGRSETAPGNDTLSFEEQVRERAYRIYLSRLREGVPGDPATDWLRAEQELRRTR